MYNIFDYNKYLIQTSNTCVYETTHQIKKDTKKFESNIECIICINANRKYSKNTVITNDSLSIDKKINTDTEFIIFTHCSVHNMNISKTTKKIKGIILQSDSEFYNGIDGLPTELELLAIDCSTSFFEYVYNLPTGLKFLQLESGDFNKSVDNLPQNLEVLLLGDNFSQSVDNLPESLIGLKLGEKFSQSIENLPINLIYLNICVNKYSNTILNFPPNLKYLKIIFTNTITTKNCKQFYKPILNIKYPKVKHLVLSYNTIITHEYITQSEDVLSIKHCIENLPESLEYLEIKLININWNLTKLPPNIKQIKIFNIKSENGRYKMTTYNNLIHTLERINLSDKKYTIKEFICTYCGESNYDENPEEFVNNKKSYYEINFL